MFRSKVLILLIYVEILHILVLYECCHTCQIIIPDTIFDIRKINEFLDADFTDFCANVSKCNYSRTIL